MVADEQVRKSIAVDIAPRGAVCLAEVRDAGGSGYVRKRGLRTRDRGGEVIGGDPKRIKEVTDIWTFAREVTSRDPNWKLIATQAAN